MATAKRKLQNPKRRAQRPQFVGMKADSSDPVLNYKKGVNERRERVQQAKKGPGFPSVADADAAWNAATDGPATPAQLKQSLDALKEDGRNMSNEQQEQPPSGMQQHLADTKAATDKNMRDFFERVDDDAREAQGKKAEPESEEKKKDLEGVKAGFTDEEREDIDKSIERLDDMRLQELIRRINTDPINNEEQRKIADERADAEDPLDIGMIISEGEAKQWVPVNDKLRIQFRQPSNWEEHEIRRLISHLVDKKEISEELSTEVYGTMTMVCSVVQINDNRLPNHIKGRGGASEFDRDEFLRKFNFITRYPSAMLQMLSTHAWWFDARVRRLFKMDSIKNG